MIGVWSGKRVAGERYGHSDVSYIKAAEFLNDGPVEDWGCGACYAKKFFNSSYIGVDGTNDFCDIQADLRYYKSNIHGILLRHVLEHNVDWKLILQNALDSCDKLALVIYTPFVNETIVTPIPDYEGVVDICFRKSDITNLLPKYKEEVVESPNVAHNHNTETIFYVHTLRGLGREEFLCKKLSLS